MTEILTESFCERCGTRYTFESSAPRKSRIGRVRMAAKGVKNFVMSDEASFSEAMADARGEEELAATAHQLDAFHKTFNFCLTCRQYTCGDCWNPSEGRCLTCAPMAGVAEPEYAPAPMAAAAAAAPTNGYHEDAPVESWPEADLTQDRLARALGTDAAFAAAAAMEDEIPSQLEVDAANDAFAEPAVDEDEPVEAVAAAEPELDAELELDEERPLAVYEQPEVAAAPIAEAMTAAPAEAAVDEPTLAEAEIEIDVDDVSPAAAWQDAVAPATAIDASMGAAEGAAYEAQASAAEQDATVEAVMDPTFDYEPDAATTVEGVAPGQSLEEAVAAYEARLAAEEHESVAATAAVADAMVAGPEPEPETEAAVETPVAVDAVQAEAVVPEVEAPVIAEAVVPEVEAPVIAEAAVPEAALASLAIAHVHEPDAAASEADAVAEPPIVEAEAPVFSAEPEVALEERVAIEAAEEPVLAETAAPVLAAEPEIAVEEPVAIEAAAAIAAEPEAADPMAWPAEDLQPTTEPVSHEAIDAALLLALARDAKAAVEPEPEPVAEVIEPEPQPVPAEVEPEPVAAAPEPEPEPVAAAPDPRTDVVPQPTWPTPAAPAPQPVPAPAPTPATPPDAVPWLMVAPAEDATRSEPQWPATPVWRAGARNTDAPTTLAGRTLLPQPDTSALWAASAQQVLSGTPADVAAAAAVAQPCVQCGLSLSANARFCRRCGTRQG